MLSRLFCSIHFLGCFLLLVAARQSDEYSFSISEDLDDTLIRLSWRLDWTTQTVDFSVDVTKSLRGFPTDVLVGFSDHGLVSGSDFCMLRVKRDRSKLYDGWIDRKGTIFTDMHNDCELLGVKADAANYLNFSFRRKFVTCDPRDYAFEIGTTNVIFAIGFGRIRQLNLRGSTVTNIKTQPLGSDVLFTMRYTQVLQHAATKPSESSTAVHDHHREEKSRTLEIFAANVPVPARQTTYWCVFVKLDEGLRRVKHHVTKYEAVISAGLEHIVHHFEVFHCQLPVNVTQGFCDTSHDVDVDARTCSRVIAAWSMGAGPVYYPPEAGMPIGGPDFVPYLKLEIHYNNEELRSDLVDRSGIRFTYTDALRKHDAGIMELGLIYSDANSIPPAQPAFPITGYCVADCTNHLPRQGVNVFATQLHAHLTGRKLFTSHFRDGVKIGEINRDNHYSPHWQHIQTLSHPIRVLQGDVLATTCVYETTNHENFTFGGYGIENEMCVNYLHYYPASPVEVCKSAVDNSTLHAFFRKLGVRNDSLKIHEKYEAVDWTPSKVNSLRELYHVAPLNVACLTRSGDPFEGHPTKWKGVPRPETFAGVYVRGRSMDECFAIND